MIRYKTEQLYPWLYRIHDPLDVYFYLIVGDSKALLFDTGYGMGAISEAVAAITTKPLYVVLGHGHIDHANGAYQFDEVYLHEGDFELCRLHCSPEYRDEALEKLAQKGLEPDFDPAVWREAGSANLKKLNPGTVFDLGGLHVEVVDMAGHTAGSVGLLVAEKRVLLDSDSANGHCWMFLEETLPVRQYVSMLERVSRLAFDVFY
ncbi:MAG: MBL fold metallo-hydrolase, partial [Clostridia bacterium]|nr:MBL fold metallo-hydrolase [Clostridia bacterium]